MNRFGVARVARACTFVAACAIGPAVQAQSLATPSGPQDAAGAAAQASSSTPRASWLLRSGQPVHAQLQGWAAQAQWQLVWQPKVSWLIVADTQFEGTFPEVAEQVIRGLFHEGKPVRLVLWEGNRVAEVVSNDIR